MNQCRILITLKSGERIVSERMLVSDAEKNLREIIFLADSSVDLGMRSLEMPKSWYLNGQENIRAYYVVLSCIESVCISYDCEV
jgi:hypothetical protein